MIATARRLPPIEPKPLAAMPPQTLPPRVSWLGTLYSWVAWERIPLFDTYESIDPVTGEVCDVTLPSTHVDGTRRYSKVPRSLMGTHRRDDGTRCFDGCTGELGSMGTADPKGLPGKWSGKWTLYGIAWETVRHTRGDYGVGFVFPQDESIVGIDLDHCVVGGVPFGDLEPWARSLLYECQTYAEWSPSGTGIHLYLRGIPGLLRAGRRLRSEAGVHIEMYSKSRFFTWTGRGVGPYGDFPITDGRFLVADLERRYFEDDNRAIPDDHIWRGRAARSLRPPGTYLRWPSLEDLALGLGLKPYGVGYRGQCPAHRGHSAISFVAQPGATVPVVVKCFGSGLCSAAMIIEALVARGIVKELDYDAQGLRPIAALSR